MASTILNYVLSLFDNKTTSTIAAHLGESESNVSSAIQSLVPTVLAGFLNKANSESNGVQNLMDQATSTNQKESLWENMASMFSGSLSASGDTLLSGLFGNNATDSIVKNISDKSHLSATSTSSLLKWIAPLVLSGLGKFISSKGLNFSNLTSLFNSERSSIMSSLPAGLSLFSGAQATADPVIKTPHSVEKVVEEKKKNNILLPLVLLILLAGILWWAMKSCNKETNTTETTTNEETATTTTTTTSTNTRTLAEVSLSN